MRKLLNWLLEFTLKRDHILSDGQTRLGDRQTAPELWILDSFSIDMRKDGWCLNFKENQEGLINYLKAKGYDVSPDGIVRSDMSIDYVYLGIGIVKTVKDYISQVQFN